eukprot:TRINITY_DN431_c1_g1_i2.p1 TRINITY_DN431_c1_g1~~TRINITY_DN431_c1_g1_i2.p1  ORF type:complete len:1062 (-),score=263.50 TRINITY_DN431_c1_g1_i2:57-3242(-)
MQEFNEAQFLRQLDTALDKIRTILDNTRNPQFASNVSHSYHDKFLLANFLTNSALAAILNSLQLIGFNDSNVKQLKNWAETRTVTLRLSGDEKCTYEREATRVVESPTTRTTTVSMFGISGNISDKVVTKITEHFWKYVVRYELRAYQGNNPKEGILLQSRTCEFEIVTSTKNTPKPEVHIIPQKQTEIGWLFKNLTDDGKLAFRINREDGKTCHTPRRNAEVENILTNLRNLYGWSREILSFFKNLFQEEKGHAFDLNGMSADNLFVPVVPLMEKPTRLRALTDVDDEPQDQDQMLISEAPQETESVPHKEKEDEAGLSPRKKREKKSPRKSDVQKSKSVKTSKSESATTTTTTTTTTSVGQSPDWRKDLSIAIGGAPYDESPVFSIGDANLLLAEQKRVLKEKLEDLANLYPSAERGKLISVSEATLCLVAHHILLITQRYYDGVCSIEQMLRKQLIAAIGKEISVKDFNNYLKFHNTKLYRPEFAPKPFCYAIRRPEHYPEGLLVLEQQFDDGSVPDPIHTICQHISSKDFAIPPLKVPINASTNVVMTGDRYLHGWITHQFSGQTVGNLILGGRARQFSSFMLILGRMASGHVFEPKHAIILQNKDDLKIPIDLEQIPTPKEFEDAIESLSPEQQRFARAFRGMQLASTLFAVCVVQIKPQLEKLLNLPADSLTKEIKLTQDLMELFMKYQIPSDQLSYDGDTNVDASVKLKSVKGHVENMLQLIQKLKDRDLEEERQVRAFKDAEERKKNQVLMYSSLALDESECAMPTMSVRTASLSKSKAGSGFKMHNLFAREQRHAPPGSSSAALPPPPPPPLASGAPPAPGGAPPPPTGAPVPAPAPVPTTTTTTTSSSTPTSPPEIDILNSASQEAEYQKESSKEALHDDIKPHYDDDVEDGSVKKEVARDYTKIPGELDQKFLKFDEDSALRATILNPSSHWSKTSYKSLLSEPSTATLLASDQEKTTNAAYDLLDALSRSGALSIDEVSLHVVIASTQCFDKTLIDTVIQDNVNPIEKVERSSLIAATTIHYRPALELVEPDQAKRIAYYSTILPRLTN